MNSVSAPPSAPDESLIGRIAGEFTERLNRGENPDVEEYAQRYPELAHVLRQALAALQIIRPLSASLAPVTSAEADAELPGTLGDFRLLREVGRGGMGIVYEAEQVSLNRRVALKVLPFAGALDARQLQRFKNEAQAAAQLHHTNIVPVHFVGCERGVHFYAMQFIEGHSLADVIAQARASGGRQRQADRHPEATTVYQGTDAPRLPAAAETPPVAALSSVRSSTDAAYFRTAAELGIQAAEALDYAHQHGIVHRDIKPANLLVENCSLPTAHCPLRLWITDFGLAQVQSDTRLTMTGDLVGTLRYMSPEQALAQRVIVDQRTDVYSLGATLYELLTLEPAFTGTERNELLRQIAFEEPRAPRRRNKAIPPELETIVLKALEKNPADRYVTAKELADDLRRFVLDEPIRARRATLMQQARKWARRHKPLVTAAGIVFLVLSVASAVSSVLIWSAYRSEAGAFQAERQAKQDAQLRRDEMRTMLLFVENNIIAAAQPEGDPGGLGHDITLRKALEAALPSVEKNFKDKPIIEARLRGTLGRSFATLGDAKNAAVQFQRARELFAKYVGPQHPDTIKCMHDLAFSLDGLGQFADAIELFKETLTLYQAILGPEHADTLNCMHNLAECYCRNGQHADAQKLYEDTLQLRKAALGSDHPATLGSMVGLGQCYSLMGRQEDALHLFKALRKICKAKPGIDYRLTFACMNGLANCHAASGDHAKAVQFENEELELCKAKLPADHPITLETMSNLANGYSALGQRDQALELRVEVLRLAKGKLGRDHPYTLRCMDGLAESYHFAKRHDEALKLRREAVARLKIVRGLDHQDTIRTMGNLVFSLTNLGRFPEALALLDECVERSTAGGAEAVRLIDDCLRRALGKAVNPRLIPVLMDYQLRHFAKIKDADGCRATAEMWERFKLADAAFLYNAACYRAITAAVIKTGKASDANAMRLADEQSDQAMAWLKQAVAAGFKDAAHIEKDDDLSALRDRDDFKMLLGELEARQQIPAEVVPPPKEVP